MRPRFFSRGDSTAVFRLMNAALNVQRDDLIRCALLKALSFERQRQLLGIAGDAKSAQIANFQRKAFEILEKNAVDRCQNTPGPTSAADLLGIERQKQLLGISGSSNLLEQASKCTSFELQFTSEMKGSGLPGVINVFTAKVSAKVKLKLVPKSAKELTGSGSGPIDYVSHQYTIACPGCTCTVASKTAGSTLTVFQEVGNFSTLIEFDFNEKEKPSGNPSDTCQLERGLRPKAITLLIDPGKLVERALSLTVNCPDGSGTLPLPEADLNLWRNTWDSFHAKDFVAEGGPAQVKDWELLGAANTDGRGGELYARKVYDRSLPAGIATFTEKTTLELFHRPNKD